MKTLQQGEGDRSIHSYLGHLLGTFIYRVGENSFKTGPRTQLKPI